MEEYTEQEIKNKEQYNKIMLWLVVGGMVTVCVLKALGLGD